MCNLYSITTNQSAIAAFARAIRDTTGNMPSYPAVFPKKESPIVRNAPDGARELTNRFIWGMPSSQQALMEAAKKRAAKLDAKGKPYDFKELLKMEPDRGTTNIRNIKSRHWTRWLGPSNRCVVPFTSFSEFDKAAGEDVWFALDETRPLAFFAGIFTEQWTAVRTIKDGLTTKDVFGFLTTDANAEVRVVHPTAMPVILRTQEEIDRWFTAPAEQVPELQKKLPDGSLVIVAKGVKEDGIAA